jgi:RimJ/RimL family protein N-acetyltransferase
MEPITLTDGDLTLRPWSADDVDAVFAACQDPEIQRWTTIPSPYSREDAEWFISTSPDRWASGEATFAAVDATSGALLGSFGLEGIERLQGPEIGFWVAADTRGRGVATRAVRRIARWAFDDLDAPRLVWRAYVGNVSSRRVAEAVGFRVEGIERRGIVQRGERRDCWLGSLLPADLARAEAGAPRERSTLEGWPDVPVTLRTERLLLRPYRASDAEGILAYSNDPEASLWDPEGVVDLEDARVRAGRRGDWSHGKNAAWVIAPPADDDMLGGIQLQLIDPENANAEIGYGLLPHARGHGYTAEALGAVTEWSFSTLALERIGLLHAVENAASCRVAEQAGYRLEGTLRQSHRFGDDKLHDEHVHARLRGDA